MIVVISRYSATSDSLQIRPYPGTTPAAFVARDGTLEGKVVGLVLKGWRHLDATEVDSYPTCKSRSPGRLILNSQPASFRTK